MRFTERQLVQVAAMPLHQLASIRSHVDAVRVATVRACISGVRHRVVVDTVNGRTCYRIEHARVRSPLQADDFPRAFGTAWVR